MGFLDRLIGRGRPANRFTGGLPLRSLSPPDPPTAPETGGPPPGPSQPRDDWRTLPSMPQTLHAARPTVQTAAFEAGLASRRSPAFLGPLGHRLDAAAPAGIAGGLATLATASPPPESGEPAGAAAEPGPAPAQRGGSFAAALVTAPAQRLPAVSRPPVACDPVRTAGPGQWTAQPGRRAARPGRWAARPGRWAWPCQWTARPGPAVCHRARTELGQLAASARWGGRSGGRRAERPGQRAASPSRAGPCHS